MQEAKSKRSGLRAASTFVIATLLCMAFVLGSGAVSFNVAAISPTADVNVELQPTYEYVKYSIDPVLTEQRWDSQGAWGLIGNAVLSNSELIATSGTGANLTHADWNPIDQGIFYDVKVMASSNTTNAFMNLTGAANYVNIALGAHYITAQFRNGTANTKVNVVGYDPSTWYDLAIYYANSVWNAQAFAANGTSLGIKVLTGANLAYGNITMITLKNLGAGTTAYFDYMYQTSSMTAFVPASTDSTGVDFAPTESQDLLHTQVDFSNPTQQPATYSNSPKQVAAEGLSYFNVTVNTVKQLNLTNMADALTTLKEPTTPVVGVAKEREFDNAQADAEAQLQSYLAGKNNVPTSDVTIVDYRMSDVTANYTWSSSIQTSAVNEWYDSLKSNAKDAGATIVYKTTTTASEIAPMFDISGSVVQQTASLDLLKTAGDVNYVDLTGVSQAAYNTMMQGISNDMRSHVLGLAMLSPTSMANITQKSFIGSAGGLFSISGVTGLAVADSNVKNVDSSYQFTDAMLGQMIDKAGYMQVDVQKASNDTQWNSVQDGKLTAAPITSVTMVGSDIVTYIIIAIVVIAIAVVVCLVFFMGKKGKKGKKRKAGSD